MQTLKMAALVVVGTVIILTLAAVAIFQIIFMKEKFEQTQKEMEIFSKMP